MDDRMKVCMHLDKAKRAPRAKLYLYHVVPFEQVSRGLIVPDRKYSDLDYLPAYQWLERELGFFPLFFAVGSLEGDAAYVTGYQNQWRRHLGSSWDPTTRLYTTEYRKAGESPNFVLFGFEVSDVVGRSYHDYQWWHCVLNDCSGERPVEKLTRGCLFKKSWSEARWLRQARRDGHLVQVVAPELDLRKASFVWARNEATRRALVAQGFDGVQVKRLLLEKD